MLKVFDSAVTMSEFPDEITLCVNISNCPGTCEECSEPWLREDVGEELTEEKIDSLIAEHPGITVFGLMGGDSDHKDVIRIANYVHRAHPGMKVGMYSGRDFINLELAQVLDLYKIGRWIPPKGDKSEWLKKSWGPLQFPNSNQLLFEKVGHFMLNTTDKFRRNPLVDLSSYIITDSKIDD